MRCRVILGLKLHRNLLILALSALVAGLLPGPASADLCDRVFLEILRDRVNAPASVDVLDHFKAQSCGAFRRNGSAALTSAFFDVFGMDEISSSNQLNDFCLAKPIKAEIARVRRDFNSGLSLDAIHMLSACAPEGMQATIETVTDDVARIRVSFIDFAQNGNDQATISKVAPAGRCAMPDAGSRVGAMGVELVCNRERTGVQDITLTLTRPNGMARSLSVHIPPDRFVRTNFTIHEFAAKGVKYWRCLETGGEKPSLGEEPRESDIVCKEDFCEQRPRATWYFFCKAELGYANRISPAGSASLKFDWQTKLEAGMLSCSIGGKLVGKARCGDNRCRSPQLQKAVCYQKFAPPEILPPKE